MVNEILKNMSEKQKEDIILNYLNSKQESPDRKFFEKATFIVPILITLVGAMLVLAVNAADVRSNGLKNTEDISELKVEFKEYKKEVNEKVDKNKDDISDVKVEYGKFFEKISTDLEYLKEKLK